MAPSQLVTHEVLGSSLDKKPPVMVDRGDGVHLATRARKGADPLLVFLPGFMSDMNGAKASRVIGYAEGVGLGALLLDYSGCGASEGVFEQGSISRWTEDAVAMIGAAGAERVLLVGSSMGGWIALRVAMALGEQVAGLVLLAPAPDFTRWGVRPSDEERRQLTEVGQFRRPSDYGGDYTYTRALIDDGDACALLDGRIGISCPVRVLHGQLDPDVPWQVSLELAERLASPDVQVTLIKDGDHRLSRLSDLARLETLIGELTCGNCSS